MKFSAFTHCLAWPKRGRARSVKWRPVADEDEEDDGDGGGGGDGDEREDSEKARRGGGGGRIIMIHSDDGTDACQYCPGYPTYCQ